MTTQQAEFDVDTTVTPVGEGRYAAHLAPGWSIGGGLNGGYQLAVVGTAISAHLVDKPDPVAISAYYLSAAEAGPATVEVEVKRAGGRMSTVAAELTQGEATRLSVLATYSDLDRFGGEVRTTATEPDLPPVEECVGRADVPSYVQEMAPLMGRFDMRFPREQTGWTVGRPTGQGRFQAWFRLDGEREPDPLSLLLVLDALPPVVFDLGVQGWAPTLELSAHVRAKPAPGWLKVQHHTRNLAGGMFEEDCEVWDSTGRLVAQSRQLALLPRQG